MTETSHVEDLAGACVQAVHNALKLELDFTQDTLPILDHYARMATRPREEILGLVAPMLGAYFGEVVRRSLGPARWHAPAEEPPEWRLEFETFFLHLNPVGVAVEAILQRDVEGWGANLTVLDRDRKAVNDAVELYGDVDEDDYYRFAVRFEVLEQVVRTLETRALERGEKPVHFGPEVYAAAALDAEAARSKDEKPN